jgi:hypothetical protein
MNAHTGTFNIGLGGERVVKFSVGKSVFRLGEEVLCWLDFADCALPCFQASGVLDNQTYLP